jgi:CMP-N,N'-diacetyllegionaminic acid synthase
MRILTVIPARGGSKGLPGKNILPLAGVPLIAYSIKAALAVPALGDVIVSTDSQEITNIARAHGADVPFIRPQVLSTDTASSVDVAIHALEFMEAQTKFRYDALLLLQPTCPLRQPEDIIAAMALFEAEQADSVISLYKLESTHPFYMYRLEEHTPIPLMPEGRNYRRRQDYPPVYVRNGAIYLVGRDVLLNTRSFYGECLRAIVMPAERSVNIDTLRDLAQVEAIIETGTS